MVSDDVLQAYLILFFNVLILVLMEYGLWQNSHDSLSWERSWVLILVLMEYGLWLPYYYYQSEWELVLILVLMEYGLWH